MTDEEVADRVYLEPLTVELVERVIARERPDALLPTLGGQTGLNLATELADAGVLDRYDVRLLGTRIETIRKAEDRELFKDDARRRSASRCPTSRVCESLDEVERVRRARSACRSSSGPPTRSAAPAAASSTTEAELERDRPARPRRLADPPGPGRALAVGLEGDRVRGDARRRRHLHHRLQHGEPRPDGRPHRRLASSSRRRRRCPTATTRCCASSAIRIIRALGIEGGCNVQFALDPKSSDVLRDRGQPARQPLVGAGLQGDRLSRSRASRRRSRSAGASRRSATRSPAGRSPPSSRRSTTASSRFRAGRSTSSRPATAASARRWSRPAR